MRQWLYFFMVSCALAGNLAADITSQLENYEELQCSFSPATTRNQRQSESGESPHVGPHMSVEEGTSLNWSGYASATNLINPQVNSVTNVAGVWIVPQLSPTPNTAYSSFWVGIDGYNNGTVEQIGTEQDWIGGRQSNYAWFEMYPMPAYEIVGFPVNPGDFIQAEVAYIGNNEFQLSIVNLSRSVYTIVPVVYTTSSVARRSSAEWIVEAPSTNLGPLPLADYREGIFGNCIATINGVTAPIAGPGRQATPLTMVTTNGIVKSIPSGLLSQNENFFVLWEHE